MRKLEAARLRAVAQRLPCQRRVVSLVLRELSTGLSATSRGVLLQLVMALPVAPISARAFHEVRIVIVVLEASVPLRSGLI